MEWLLFIIGAVVIVVVVDKFLPPTSCNYNCNQGRNCTCKSSKNT